MLIAKLINEIRMGFCKHDFEFICSTNVYDVYKDENNTPQTIIKIYRCKKCGYTQKNKN